MTELTDRLPGLHALRVAAALGVFIAHGANWLADGTQSASVTMILGNLSVGLQLFYVVSAFALMHSTRLYESAPDWVTQFYLKRLWRIAPLFYVMIVVDGLYTYYTRRVGVTFPEVVLNVLFLNNLSPKYTSSIVFTGWSVSVEMLFYSVFPLVLVYIRSIKAGIALVIAAVVIGKYSRIYLEQIPAEPPLSYADFCVVEQLQYFALGVLAYLVYERLKLSGLNAPASRLTTMCHHALFAVPLVALAWVIRHFGVGLQASLRTDLTLYGLLFALMTVWLAVVRVPALNCWPIQFYGERSYSLYLLHFIAILSMRSVTMPMSQFLQPFLGNWTIVPALIVVYLAVIAAAPVTYAFIEKPGMDFGRKLRLRWKL